MGYLMLFKDVLVLWLPIIIPMVLRYYGKWYYDYTSRKRPYILEVHTEIVTDEII